MLKVEEGRTWACLLVIFDNIFGVIILYSGVRLLVKFLIRVVRVKISVSSLTHDFCELLHALLCGVLPLFQTGIKLTLGIIVISEP